MPGALTRGVRSESPKPLVLVAPHTKPRLCNEAGLQLPRSVRYGENASRQHLIRAVVCLPARLQVEQGAAFIHIKRSSDLPWPLIMPPSHLMPAQQATDNRPIRYTERVGVFWDVEVSLLSLTCFVC